MNLSIQREELLKPLSVVAGVVEKRQTLPILANVLLRYDGSALTLIGTDLEVEVVSKVAVSGGGQGDITLPARKLLDICKALPGEATLDLRLDKEKAVVKSGRSRFTLTTMPAGEFPNIETANWDFNFSLPQGVLKGMLEKTQFCMAQQDVRYYLNGLLLELAGKRMRTVATDGHRLAMAETTLSDSIDGEKQVILPRKGVLEMSRFLEHSDQEVQLRLGTNHLRIETPQLVFTTKLIDGRFPDYNKVIPTQQSKRLMLARDTLRETLQRVAILSNEKYRGVRFSLSNGLMQITAHNPEQEEAREEMPIDYSGEEMEIGFNVNYVLDAIGALDSKEIEMGLNDANSSCTLRSPGNTQQQYVVMPMRL